MSKYSPVLGNDFPSTWNIYRLDELGSFTKGAGITKSDLVPSGIPCVRYGEIYTTHDFILKKFHSFIPPEIAESSKQIQAGDILFAGSGETAEEIGKCVAYIGNERAYAGGDVIILRLKKGDPEYLGYLLNHEIVKRQKSRLGQGYSVVHIYSSHLKDVVAPLPSAPEQRKIANILSIWNDTIINTGQLIKSLQEQKKGLSERLLLGQVRFKEFKDEWKEIRLGQFLKPVVRKVEKPKTAYARLGIRSHGKGTFISTVEDSDTVAMTHLFRVEKGDFIINITFAWEGAVAMVGEDGHGALVSHRFPTYTFDTKKVLPAYFKYVMLTKRFFYDLGVISPGGAGRNRVLSKTDFLKLKVSLPSIEEQKKIGEALSAIDDHINILNSKLELLRQQKVGLMQKLLTGQIRVKV